MKILFGLIGLALVLWSLSKLIKPKFTEIKTTSPDFSSNSAPETGKQILSIQDISVIWAKRKEVKIKLEELAILWKNMQSQLNYGVEKVHFFSPVISDFYKKYLDGKLYFTGNVKKVIIDILTLLDTEGEVSSVVSGQSETESKLPQNTFQMLSKISLTEHTIHVAEEILTIVPFGANAPKALIAALGHDLGKLPKFRNQYYTLGDHPFISVTVLDSIQSFKELVYADDILKAIRDHHLKPKDFLGEALKEADQRARRRELIFVQKNINIYKPTEEELNQSDPNVPEPDVQFVELNKDEDKQNQTENQTQQSNLRNKHHFLHQTHQTISKDISKEAPIPNVFLTDSFFSKDNKQAIPASDIFISTTDEGKESVCLKELELNWFNVEEFLQILLSYVNQVISGRWLACSMPDGLVYVQPRLIWMILKEMASQKGIHDLLLAENDESQKRDYIYTVLKQIQHHKNAIETSLIQDGYFSAPFIVQMKSGQKHRALYVPIKAQEAFGVFAGELEAKKEGKLREIESIIPPYACETFEK
ncbi:HD domain-containing protein [Thermodesulfovibrio sp. TK110]